MAHTINENQIEKLCLLFKAHEKAVVRELLMEVDTLIIEYLDGLYDTGEFIDIFTNLKKKYTERYQE